LNDLIALLVGERNGSASFPPVVLHRLPSQLSPHLPKVIVRPKMGDGETERHGCRWRSERSSIEEDRGLKRKKANGKVISTLSRDSFSLPALTTLGKMSCMAPSVDTPTQFTPPMTRGPRVHMSNGAGQTIGNSKIS
jgi:hypothetical protein